MSPGVEETARIFTEAWAAELADDAEYELEEINQHMADAIAEGLIPVFGNEYTLQIDIDSEEAFKIWEYQWKILKKCIPYIGAPLIRPSKSGLPCRHITINLHEPLDLWQRIALQAVLGSDIRREALNARRAILGVEPNIMFLEVDQAKVKAAADYKAANHLLEYQAKEQLT